MHLDRALPQLLLPAFPLCWDRAPAFVAVPLRFVALLLDMKTSILRIKKPATQIRACQPGLPQSSLWKSLFPSLPPLTLSSTYMAQGRAIALIPLGDLPKANATVLGDTLEVRRWPSA